MRDLVVVAGPSSTSLAEGVAQALHVPVIGVKADVFPDGESRVKITGETKGKTCILFQSMYPPVDRHLFQGLLLARKLSRDGCRVHGVIPYLPYSRQDRAFLEGEAISAELVAYLLSSVGFSSVATVDIHSSLAAQYFTVPLHNLTAVGVMADFLVKNHDLRSPLVISPDFGGSVRAENFAKAIGAELFALSKHRDRATGQVFIDEETVPVSGRDAVIVDDIISTGGSVVKASELLIKGGAHRVFALCTHPILAGNALEKIMNSGVWKTYATNSIPSSVSVINLAPLIAGHLEKTLEQG